MSDPATSPDDLIAPEPATRSKRRSAVLLFTPIAFLALAFGGWSIFSALNVPNVVVAPGVPDAPQLTATGEDEVVYRIDAYRSSVRYEAEEILGGVSNTATGTTSGIAGDILLDTTDPSASEIGDIVVNVEQLTSDQTLRDNRLRHDFLQSTEYPLATLSTTSITGFPDAIEDDVQYDLEVTADLTVKDLTRPYTFDAQATRSGDSLRIFATIDVLMSDYDIGPISLGPLVSSGNEVTLIIELDALDTRVDPTPNELTATSDSSVAHGADAVSFASDVQPILEKNCASCHAIGESGSQVWTLDTAADAAAAGQGLELVTATGYMPPWPASDVGVPLKHSRKLSDADLKTLADWAALDTPIDVDPSTKIVPSADQIEAEYEIRDDLVLTPNEAYQGSPAIENDYRCLIYDPGFTEPTYITGTEFRPDQTENVHHMLGYRVPADQVEQTLQRDADDPGAGWQCYAGMSAPSSGGGGQIMGWVPGQRPGKLPEGSGIRMEAGDIMVLQIHYHFLREPDPDLSALAVEVSDATDLDPVVTQTYLGPAEIPCLPDESGPMCDRATVIQRLMKDYGPAAAFIPDGLMRACGNTVDDFAEVPGGIATSSCDLPVRRSGELLAVHGHEHEIGNSFRMTLNPDTPDEKILLDIPDWDFQWQLVYSPEEQITLERGDVLRIECTWDRSLIKSSEPLYITWAEGTDDEMCYSTVTTRERREP